MRYVCAFVRVHVMCNSYLGVCNCVYARVSACWIDRVLCVHLLTLQKL